MRVLKEAVNVLWVRSITRGRPIELLRLPERGDMSGVEMGWRRKRFVNEARVMLAHN